MLETTNLWKVSSTTLSNREHLLKFECDSKEEVQYLCWRPDEIILATQRKLHGTKKETRKNHTETSNENNGSSDFHRKHPSKSTSIVPTI